MMRGGQMHDRIAAVALLLICVAAAALLIGAPLLQRHNLNAAMLSAEQEKLTRLNAFVASAQHGNQTNQPVPEQKRRLISGQTVALQIANVQSDVLKLLETSGLRASAVRALSPPQVAGLDRVGIQVETTGKLASLTAFLTTFLKPDTPYAIDEMRIAPVAPHDAQRRDMVTARLHILAFAESVNDPTEAAP